MASGTINLNNSSQTSGGGYLMGKVDWSGTGDIASNQSSVTANFYVKKASSTGIINVSTTGHWDCSMTIGDSNVSQSVSASIGADWVLMLTATVPITHNSDGSKSITIAATAWGPSGTSYSGLQTVGSGTAVLDTIPRASTIGATDANIGATSMIAVNRKSSGYTHSIAYKFGTLSGYVTSSGGVSTTESKFTNTSIAFIVPTSFYAQIPNSKTGTCTLTIKTYSGTTQIGDAKTCTFTATAAEANCKPTVSGTVVDSNDVTKALTGDERKLVQYYSTALCTIAATAKNSATISDKTIAGSSVSGNTRSIPNVWFDSVSFIAKDSRGYSTSITVSSTMVPYVKLTNNATGTRTDPTSGNATLNLKGNYYNGSFGAVDNGLEIKYRIGDGEYISVAPTISGNTYSTSVSLTGLDYTQAYTVDIVVTDKLASVSKNVTIGKGVPVFDWGDSDMNIHVPLRLDVPLGVAYGGTGKSSAADAANALINALSTGSAAPVDADYYVSQYAGGGTTHTTYHRRPMSTLWSYIKGKIGLDSNGVLPVSKGGTGAETASAAVQNLFDCGMSVKSYPTKPGIYRMIGTNIFKNMKPSSNYGVLVIFKSTYAAHFYLDGYGDLYYGYSGDTFKEPSKWYKPSVTQMT